MFPPLRAPSGILIKSFALFVLSLALGFVVVCDPVYGSPRIAPKWQPVTLTMLSTLIFHCGSCFLWHPSFNALKKERQNLLLKLARLNAEEKAVEAQERKRMQSRSKEIMTKLDELRQLREELEALQETNKICTNELTDARAKVEHARKKIDSMPERKKLLDELTIATNRVTNLTQVYNDATQLLKATEEDHLKKYQKLADVEGLFYKEFTSG